MSALPCVLAYDLGTGGAKAAVYSADGACLGAVFEPYATFYPALEQHEQRPQDWWDAVVASARRLLAQPCVDPASIVACAISGHSLGVVPMSADGQLLRKLTPIWSDSRAQAQAAAYFTRIGQAEWYRRTGNGFPAPLYPLFKIMWLREHEPELFRRTDVFLGTKDYVNYRLTGRMVTDPSYASGSGAYDLSTGRYAEDLLAAAGFSASMLPEILPSSEPIGAMTDEAAAALGLPRGVKVMAGGVDKSCMALGARNTADGRVYNSLGSSSWIAVSSARPLLDDRVRPFVFAHVVPGLFSSAVSIFAAGSSFRWVRDTLCADMVAEAARSGGDAYELMTALAEQSPVGANGVLFNPSLAGGTSLDASRNVSGAFLRLELRHTRADLVRAAMEGVALGLRQALDALRGLTTIDDEMLAVGGGAGSRLWRQILADVYGATLVKTNVDQHAAALGAAALAAVGAGLWADFAPIDAIHEVQSVEKPIDSNRALYDRLSPIFRLAATQQAALGDHIASSSA